MRFIAPVLAAGLCLATLAGLTLAGEKSANGKDLYKQNCRVCHDRGSQNGEYSPLTLIQDQWKTFFNEKVFPVHKDLSLPGRSEKLLDVLTPEQVKAIQKFCVEHAADSEQPQTCS